MYFLFIANPKDVSVAFFIQVYFKAMTSVLTCLDQWSVWDPLSPNINPENENQKNAGRPFIYHAKLKPRAC